MRRAVQLNGQQLKKIIAESVKNALNDGNMWDDEKQEKEYRMNLEAERRRANAMHYFRIAQDYMKKGLSQLEGKHRVDIYLEGEASFLPVPDKEGRFKCTGNIQIDGKVEG